MVKLTEKYAKTIAEMKADAQANVVEAEESVKERTEELQECKEEVRALKDTAKSSKSAFFGVIKDLGKLAITRNPSPEEVSKVLEPCNTYVMAAGQLPGAQENLKEAKEELSKAQKELFDATVDLENISSFA